MTANTTWIRRVAAGAVLVAAPALIALGTATASHADANTNANANATHRTSPTYAPTPSGSLNDWHQSSWHQRHAAEQQSKYR